MSQSLRSAGQAGGSRVPQDGAHHLSAGPMRARVCADFGGRITALWREEPKGRRTDVLVPIEDAVFDPIHWPKGGCYPLVPWSNRIRDAKFSAGGEEIRLEPHPACPPQALHGFAQQRPWTVTRATSDSVAMEYRHTPDAWPWAFITNQRISLDTAGMSIELSVRNLSDRSMPVGLGLHPFLVVDQGDLIRFTCETRWLADAAGCGIDTRQLDPAEARYEAPHGPHPLGEYFSDFGGIASIARADGTRIVIETGPPLDHLIFHVPQGGAYACIEPVSHVADAFNLVAQGRDGSGARTLSPGESISAIVRLGLA